MWVTLLFWFQIIMAWVYTIPQLINIYNGKIEGLNLTMYVLFMTYIILSLCLAIGSYMEVKEKSRKQTIIVFSQWFICFGLIIFFGIDKIIWKNGDTIITLAVVVLSTLTIFWYKGIKDPYSKALINVWCKSIPQLWLAYTIFLAESGAGLPFATLVAGFLTAVPRLIQVMISGKKGWDRPTKGLFIGEGSNVVTWSVVIPVWTYYFLITFFWICY